MIRIHDRMTPIKRLADTFFGKVIMHALSRGKNAIFIGRMEFTRSGEVGYVDGHRFRSGNYRKSIFLFARIRISFIGRVHLMATTATNDEEEQMSRKPRPIIISSYIYL